MQHTSFGAAGLTPPVLAEFFVISRKLACETPQLAQGFEYWLGKQRGGRLPGRQDIDPGEIPSLLPNIMLADVLPAEPKPRLRFRLVGDYHVEVAGGNWTGRFFDEVTELQQDEGNLIECYQEVAERRIPHYWAREYIDPQKRWASYERVALPLARDGETVDMILAILMPFRKPHITVVEGD